MRPVSLGNYHEKAEAVAVFRQVRDLFPDEDAMLALATRLRLDASKAISSRRFSLNIGGEAMSIPDASKHLGVSVRTAYSLFHLG